MDELLPTVRDVMTDRYVALRPSASLLEAVSALEGHAEDTALVVDEQQQLLGLLGEKDCLRVLSARAYDGVTAETVQDVMSPAAVVLSPDTDAYAAAQAFLASPYGMLPVIEDGRLTGAVSQLGLLRTFIGVLQHRSTALHEVEQTAEDLRDRPEAKEPMQRVASNLNPDQIATVFRRSTRKDE